jgi:hemerythrin
MSISPPSGGAVRAHADSERRSIVALIEWSEEKRIGFDSLDEEHRELSVAINALHDSLWKEDHQALAGPLLKKVVDGTHTHFANEEAMMSRYKYPGTMLHVMKHQLLLQQGDALLARLNGGSFILDEYSLKFLRDWFTVHIDRDDRNFAVWLREHAGR